MNPHPTSALHEICHPQSTYLPLLSAAPMARLVTEKLQDHGNYKVTSDSLLSVKEAVEEHLQLLFERAKYCTAH